MEISLLDHLSVSFLTAPEGSTVCTHAANCMPLLVRPSQIHPLLFIPSLHVCVSVSGTVHILADVQRCLVGNKQWKHELWIVMNNKISKHNQSHLTINYSLLCFHSLPLSGSSTFFLLSLCSSGWPGYWKLRETLMCSDVCDSVRGAESLLLLHDHDLKLWFSVIKWMMTKHFISAQWVRYSSWGIRVLSDRSSCDMCTDVQRTVQERFVITLTIRGSISNLITSRAIFSPIITIHT